MNLPNGEYKAVQYEEVSTQVSIGGVLHALGATKKWVAKAEGIVSISNNVYSIGGITGGNINDVLVEVMPFVGKMSDGTIVVFHLLNATSAMSFIGG